MGENVGTIYYTVEAETSALLSAEKAVSKSMGSMAGEMTKADKAADQLNATMTGLSRAIKTVIAASALRSAVNMVEQYREMNERIRQASESTAEYEMVQSRLQASARETFRALSETQETYITTSAALKALGYSTQSALDLTDSLALGFVVSSASADRAQSAIDAYSSSMAKGKTDADAWGGMLRAIPDLAAAVADATGKSELEVRRLGAAGKLTANQINSGLLKVLPEWRKRAAEMAATTKDAGRNMMTGLVAALDQLDKQAGGIDALVKGMNMAGKVLQDFGDDSERVAQFLRAMELAASSVAAVIAGRVLMAIGGYVKSQGQAVAATLERIAADRNAALGAVRRAEVEKIAAMQAVATARAEFDAARGTNAHAFAADALVAAQQRAASAAGTYAAAQARANSIAGAGAMVMSRLRTAMAFLGGPAGVILLAATALYTLASGAGDAKEPVDALAGAVDELSNATIRLQTIAAKKQLADLEEQARKLSRSVLHTREAMDSLMIMPNQENLDHLEEMEAQLQKNQEEAQTLTERLKDLAGERDRRAKGGKPATPGTPPDLNAPSAKDTDAIKKQIDALWEQADAYHATAAEIALFKLQQAGADDAQMRSAASALALIEANERLLQSEEDLQESRERINAAGGADAYINGGTQPLSGGMFDQQTERYDAERKAEEQRYKEQLQRMAQVQAAEQQHMVTKEQLYQQHVDRMNQIDKARADLTIQTAGAAFGQMSNDLMAFATVYGKENRKMFEIAKAAAIASTMAETYLGAQRAFSAMAGIPVVGPGLGTAAATAAVLGGMARVTQIRTQSMPGRQYGGPVAAGGMYRVNETGAPEVFNAANGRQYMLPNQRGEVVSNGDASGGSGAGANITHVWNITPGMDEAIQAEITRMLPMITEATARGVQQQIARGGSMARSVGRR